MLEPGRYRILCHHRLLAGLLVLLAGLVNSAIAQTETGDQPRLYDVEVIVFRQRSPQADGEQWPRRSEQAEREQGNNYFSKPAGTGIRELARDQQSLQNIADALQRSGVYDVLLHTAWRQAGLDRNQAQPYTVPPGLQRAGYRLEGTIRLIRERFLHLDIDLLLSKPAALIPGQALTTPEPVYELKETRRIRSGELHYFDHPWFGVIAKVVPYAVPEPPEMPVPAGAVRMEGADPAIVNPLPVAPAATEPAE